MIRKVKWNPQSEHIEVRMSNVTTLVKPGGCYKKLMGGFYLQQYELSELNLIFITKCYVTVTEFI